MSSLEIAQVLASSQGGIGRHAASVIKRLVGAGHQVSLYCPAETRDAHEFHLAEVQWRPLSRLGQARTADVVHAHGYKAGLLAASLTRPSFPPKAGPPVVVSWHNAVLAPRPGASIKLQAAWRAALLLQRLVARLATVTLGASTDLVAEARRLGAKDARLSPVAAVELAPARKTREETRQLLGIPGSAMLILTVTRLAPQKNLELLVEIAARLRSRPELIFAIVGEGPARAELSARIAEAGVKVHLLGQRSDIADLLAAADIALLTSTWEARSLFAQEALSAGVPFVGTRVGGIEELVGSAAVLFDLNDPEQAAISLIQLADDPIRRDELRWLGLVQAATWPDEAAVAADLVRLYRELARDSSAGPIRNQADPPIG